MHHEAKIDAPSGTAVAIAEAAAEGKGADFLAPAAEKEVPRHPGRNVGGRHDPQRENARARGTTNWSSAARR